MGKLATAVITLITIGAFQNCSQAKFSSGTTDGAATAASTTPGNGGTGQITQPPPTDLSTNGQLNQINTNPNSCYSILHQATEPVKLLFVVDQSGSNAGSSGTDPQKTVRGGSIQTFFADYSTKANFSWGMIGFSNDATSAFVASGQTPVFTTVSATMQAGINSFMAQQDGGNTPYQLALDQAKAVIAADTTYTSATKYIVVFLSDGMPNPAMTDAALIADVSAIVNIHPGQISLSTVFYGTADPLAPGRLSLMAQTGGGYFLDTTVNPTGKDFLISNIVNVPGSSCTQ